MKYRMLCTMSNFCHSSMWVSQKAWKVKEFSLLSVSEKPNRQTKSYLLRYFDYPLGCHLLFTMLYHETRTFMSKLQISEKMLLPFYHFLSNVSWIPFCKLFFLNTWLTPKILNCIFFQHNKYSFFSVWYW